MPRLAMTMGFTAKGQSQDRNAPHLEDLRPALDSHMRRKDPSAGSEARAGATAPSRRDAAVPANVLHFPLEAQNGTERTENFVWAKHQPWVDPGFSRSEMVDEIEWNLWSHRQQPFHSLDEGDIVVLVSGGGPLLGRLMWTARVLPADDRGL